MVTDETGKIAASGEQSISETGGIFLLSDISPLRYKGKGRASYNRISKQQF